MFLLPLMLILILMMIAMILSFSSHHHQFQLPLHFLEPKALEIYFVEKTTNNLHQRTADEEEKNRRPNVSEQQLFDFMSFSLNVYAAMHLYLCVFGIFGGI